ncbi:MULTISPECIES: hypothetical protein [Dehalococcoides]|jgi:hypothetical protein|uniref:Uncharacterized protein n=2 Tax=Dehalococcoides mccartyi TaxID=61435 RepID=A0A142VAK3_9CHLR|nr:MULTISPECIES: hypothetical protein [Dehalococcoides]AGG06683.1 hypothetical protein dcmb_1083 [Dehalococcoides mccartyi DCMB5]AGG08176.1 hypothetical protein btf_1100 [Dehalococcoides mccartyi BTF08]AII61185.1 hypothetical protein X794_05090 [Dehalococcoides mccartyi CG5]AMU86873.1 hypothetical protein Dm11a5_1047 [Dehalococcoides mccartyi]AOV99662.1 hypothetical protein DCWBC2_1036 [Dehalococcoides mccartyi]
MLNKGDMVSVTYRVGWDQSGQAMLETLEHCTVEKYKDGILVVSYATKKDDYVEIVNRTFDVNSPEFVGTVAL